MTTEHNPIASCDDFNDALADLLERELPESARAAMEAHALSCNDCGPLLADLRKLRLDAANLPELVPSRDLWAGIAERIETPVVEIGMGGATRGVRVRSTRIWAGLAAAALVGVTATTTYVLTKRSFSSSAPAAQTVAAGPVTRAPIGVLSSPDMTTPAVSAEKAAAVAAKPAGAATVSLASNKLSPEATYDLEIGRLRKIVDRRRNELDSTTVVVLEKNLKIIDDAIAQCRLALKKDPASSYLNESLNEALDNKVQLLRTAAGLPARM